MQPRTTRAGFDPTPHRAALCAIIDAVIRAPGLDAKGLDRIVRRETDPHEVAATLTARVRGRP